MKQTIFVIGANAALAKDVIPVLAEDNTVITGGKKHCDVYCDIAKAVSVPDGTDVVINFAAVFGGTSDQEIQAALETNVHGVLNICMAAKKVGVRHVINLSSLSAVLDKASPYYSIYAITKRHADELAQFYCKLHDMPLTILRPSQIYGDDDSFAAHQPLFYHIVDKAQKGEDISIYGTNDALRNYIHSADLAETIKRVVAKRIEGVYSCIYPSDVRYSQIAHAAQKVFGTLSKVSFLKDKPDIPDNVFAKDLAIYKATGYSPQISLEAGIQRIKAYRERQAG